MSGYDYDCGMYGPDGRVYQIDYALKASESQGLGIGLKLKDGVVITVQRQFHSPLQEVSSSRVFQLTDEIVAVVVGIIADGRVLCQKLLEQVQGYQMNYDRQMPLSSVVDAASSYMQQHTHYSSVRPFGCALFLTDGRQLFQIQPSGDFLNCFATAAGKKAPNARVELEKLMGEEQNLGQDRFGHLKKTRNEGGNLKQIDCATGLKECAKIMWAVFDENADQKWYVEGVVVNAEGKVQKLGMDQMQQIVKGAEE
ncbi:20S_proteasome alpha subunit 7 [Hexamita inflata]|uniref:20S proteasome alpha subunit 7 n=1 Tax=Hexamita inflata TaxID=28002 RepID=A0AA86UPA2_9EUKA|nr:20S proteasome alpha subunit 7 [Hexamita inflata]CAI9964618.1 20S proteasome alpha subunit 7 [Hexamita inflata]